MSDSPSLEPYLQQSISWELDRAVQSARSAKRAWIVAGVAAACALCASLALLCLVPLKRVEPYLIRVDGSSGAVDVVPVYAGHSELGEAVTRYLLVHYVQTCERFSGPLAESDYEECGAFHTAQRNQAWYALWNPANPLSPLNLHRDGSTVLAQVTAVSFLQRAGGANDLAQVRYIKFDRPAGEGSERASHWIATVHYAYGAPATDPRVRRWNPLGFKVLEFISEPELLADAHEPPPAGRAGR